MESRATLEAGKPSRHEMSELKEGGHEGDPGENETCPLGIWKEPRVSLSLQLAYPGERRGPPRRKEIRGWGWAKATRTPPLPAPASPSKQPQGSGLAPCLRGLQHPNSAPQSHLHPNVVCSKVVIPTQKKMVPMSWLVAHWSYPTHIASASRKGTAMVPLKHVR